MPIESAERLAMANTLKYRVHTATSDRETRDYAEAQRWHAETPGATLEHVRFMPEPVGAETVIDETVEQVE